MNKITKIFLDQNKVKTLFNIPSEKELTEFYNKTYYQKKISRTYKKKYNNLELRYLRNFNKIFNFFIKGKKKKILDLGCGEGYTLKFFLEKKHDCYGVDFSDYAIKSQNIKTYKKIKFVKANLEKNGIPFKSKFDVIIAKNLLEHVKDYYGVLKKISKSLKKNGLFIATVPNDDSLIFNTYLKKENIKFNQAPFIFPREHFRYFSKDTFIKSIIKTTKFKKIRVLSSFPIEIFILNKTTNYYKLMKFGPEANKIRILFMNLILENFGSHSIDILDSFSKIGVGRELIGIFKK